jgi:CRISPR/Cas system CSM-associated protein Csm3 (group 7 of RAMP superfamily)
MKITHRYIARFTIEAATPLLVGSGEKGLTVDKLVVKDANNLPYIPATGLAGVLRHAFESAFDKQETDKFFGFSEGDKGEGSRIKLSAAHLVGEDEEGKITVMDGLQNVDFDKGFYTYFDKLPERDHVKISDKGTAVEHAKFDEQVVHKGTRFVFEMELIGTENDAETWQNLLNLFAAPMFRLGSGTRKGLGKIKIITEKSHQKIFDLTQNADLMAYLEKSSRLDVSLNNWSVLSENTTITDANWTAYTLNLTAKDFFLFAAGFGDEEADSKPKTELFFDWTDGIPNLIKAEQRYKNQKEQDTYLLIPATSIKGAIAHRVAFHYNKLKAESIEKLSAVQLSTSINAKKAIENFYFGVSETDIENDIENASMADLAALKQKIEAIKYDDFYEKSTEWSDFKKDLADEVLGLELTRPVMEGNTAVRELFGFAKNSEKDEDGKVHGLRGRVIIDDVYLPYKAENKNKDKIFNHTKIDRFTNGTIDGALFQEKVAYKNSFYIEIWVENTAFDTDEHIKTAFEEALKDLRTGKLTLGANASKGHGVFIENLNAKPENVL